MKNVINAEDLKIKIKTKALENHLEPQAFLKDYYIGLELVNTNIISY